LIRDLARQQVSLQNAIVQPLGRTADGLMKFNVQVPKGLDAVANKTAIAKKELQIYNKVIQDGGVQLINWGKNTQWAGRQLTVGLTVPLAAFGMAAAKAFREADQELVRLTKVYGGIAATSAVDLSKVRSDVTKTARELASAYGSSFKDTISLAADIAATGKQGNDLLLSVKETTRLAVLGEVDRQDAMKATLAIQNAFKQSTTELSESINFLNAVENQTSTSLGDLIEAIPKAGPVVQSLGGNVQDLALYLTAMKEGGINASEGANALKSALASMINPTKVAREMFSGLGIDLGGIVTQNAGNLTATITALQSSLDKLNPLQKSQAIEQLFGKFQFARLSALFENLGKEGSQTLQVMDLMKASSADLANVAGRELSQITESASGKYQRALQTLKADLAGVGESFLNVQTFFLNLTSSVVKFIDMLPGPIKSMLTLVAGITALAGPIIMLTGVFANFIGYVIKGIGHLKALFRGGEGFKLLTPEILAASKAGSLVEKTFYSDAAAADILSASLKNLITEFTILQQKAASGAISVQPTIATLAGTVAMAGTPGGMYKGVTVDPNNPLVGRMGTRASAHMNAVGDMTEAERAAQTIFSMVPGPIPVNRKIGKNPQMYANHGLPAIPGLTTIGGVSTGVIPEEAAKWHAMTGAIAMQSEAEIALLKKEVAATGTVTHELSGSYQALLPEITRLTKLAAQEGAEIVAQTQAGALTVEQARAKIVALNARVEAMIAETTTNIAIAQGRTANLTTVPFTNQPVVDPKTGKSNMKEMFHKTPTALLVDNVARALGGVRTSGAGYSTHTTIQNRNQGGPIYYNDGSRSVVPGPNVNADVVPAMLTPGEFVVNKKATQANLGLLQSINSGKLGGSVSSSQGGYGPRPSAADISRMFNGLFSKAKSRSTVKVRGHSLPRHFWSTATGQDANSRRIDLIESHTAGWPIKNKQGREYTQRELELLSKAEVNEIWKGVDRSHFAPGLKVGSDGQYISPGLFGPQTRGGAGGNLSMNQGGSPQDILDSLLGTPIHPFATMRSASRLLGYPSKDINSAFDLAWKELTATLKTRTTPFGKDQDTFEEFAGSILKRHLKNLKVPDTSINFYDEMHRLGTARGSGIKGSGASVVANDPDITFNIPQRRMGGPVSGASPYIVGEDGPELFVPQNSGKIIPGFNKGGQIQHLAGGGQVMAMLMRMIPGMAGYGLGSQLTGGSMMGGMAGSIGGDLLGGMLANKILNLGKAAEEVTKKVSLTQKALSFLKAKPVFGWTAAILAGAAIIKSVNDKINEHRRVINLAFGQTAESASKLGINYKSLNEQLKDFKAKTDLAAAAAASFYASSTSANGLHITIEQLKELKESVKKDLPDLIEVFNKAGGDEVVQKASQLKAQFIAGGMSAEKATNTIYALIETSNKAGMALGVLADQGFGLIKDNAAAAVFSIETFNRLLNEGNTDQLATSLETALNAVRALEESTIGTKDANGDLITQSTAWLDVLDKANKAQGSNAILTEVQFNAIKKTIPQFADILNGSEKTAAVLAKWKLYLSDANIELKYMNDEMAIALATAQINLTSILTGGQSGTDLDKLYIAIKKAENANKTNASVIQKNAQSAQDALKEEIKLHQDNIDKIKEEADTRRRSLSRQSEDEDILTQIKKKQLEYQDALAMGDSATAAQTQLDLMSLQKSQEKTLAIRAIDDKERSDTKVQQDIIDNLQKKLDASSKTLQTQLDGVKAATSKLEELKILMLDTAAFIAKAGNINTDEERNAANALQKRLDAAGFSDVKIGTLAPSSSETISKNFITKLFGPGAGSLAYPGTTGVDSILNKVIVGNKLTVADVNSLKTAGLLKDILAATKEGSNVPAIPVDPTKVTTVGAGSSGGKFITAADLKKSGVPLIPGMNSYSGRTIIYRGEEYTVGPFNENLKQYPLIIKKAMGGPIKHYEPGGNVRGPGTGTSDSIPAMLSNGEYVIKADSVKKYGTETFDALNAGKFAEGGSINKAPSNNTNWQGGSLMDWEGAWKEANKEVIKITVPPIMSNFATNSFALNKEQRLELQEIAKYLVKNKLKSIVVEGHTDSVGKGKDNKVLSQNRANAISEYLSNLVPGTSFIPVGYGEYKPLVPNDNGANRAANRRTELILPDKYKTIYPEYKPENHKYILSTGMLVGGGGIEGTRGTIGNQGYIANSGGSIQSTIDWGKLFKKIKSGLGFANGGLVGYHKGGAAGHKHLPAGHMASNYKAPKPFYKKVGNFVSEMVKETGRSVDWFTSLAIAGQTASKPKFISKNNQVLSNEIQYAVQTGNTSEAYKAFAIKSGLSAANIGSLFLGGAPGAAVGRTAVEAVGIKYGIPALGSLLPKGSITYASKSLPAGISAATNAGLSKETIASIAVQKAEEKAATAAYRESVKVPLPYQALNTFNQYANYFKAKKLVKTEWIGHGSSDRGNSYDPPFSGTSVLDGSYARDPYYGMGFFGTSSRAEADLYAGGYNVPGQWGESFGSINRVTKIPRGKYIDFRNKNLKSQNYLLWKLLQGKDNHWARDVSLGMPDYRYAGEELGSLMNQAGTTGSIMPRISAGQAPGDINNAIWLALNKPKGTVLQEETDFLLSNLRSSTMGPGGKSESLDIIQKAITVIPKALIKELYNKTKNTIPLLKGLTLSSKKRTPFNDAKSPVEVFDNNLLFPNFTNKLINKGILPPTGSQSEYSRLISVFNKSASFNSSIFERELVGGLPNFPFIERGQGRLYINTPQQLSKNNAQISSQKQPPLELFKRAFVKNTIPIFPPGANIETPASGYKTKYFSPNFLKLAYQRLFKNSFAYLNPGEDNPAFQANSDVFIPDLIYRLGKGSSKPTLHRHARAETLLHELGHRDHELFGNIEGIKGSLVSKGIQPDTSSIMENYAQVFEHRAINILRKNGPDEFKNLESPISGGSGYGLTYRAVPIASPDFQRILRMNLAKAIKAGLSTRPHQNNANWFKTQQSLFETNFKGEGHAQSDMYGVLARIFAKYGVNTSAGSDYKSNLIKMAKAFKVDLSPDASNFIEPNKVLSAPSLLENFGGSFKEVPRLGSLFPKPNINSLSVARLLAKVKAKIKGPESLSNFESSLLKAHEAAKNGGFLPIESLNKDSYATIIAEMMALKREEGRYFPGLPLGYKYQFRPAPTGLMPNEQSFKLGIHTATKDRFNINSEKIGPSHEIVVYGPDGFKAGEMRWDSVTGAIKYIGVPEAHEGKGLARFMNDYAFKKTRLKHSLNRTTAGMAYSNAIGGIMPDKPSIGGTSIHDFADVFGMKLPEITLPKIFKRKTEVPFKFETNPVNSNAYNAAKSEFILLEKQRALWRSNRNRTYNTYPFGHGGALSVGDSYELKKLMIIGNDTPAATSYRDRPYPFTPPSERKYGPRGDRNPFGPTPTGAAKGGYISKFATGGYVNPSYSPSMSVPQFKNGINMVPADMLAMIHKNEAVVPANMNPFNPNANNATMAPAVYNISMNNHAAEGMDVNVFADVTTRKVLAEIKRLDVQRASMNGIGRRV
jgi:TP901 family phage tail tape measure protein